MKRTNRETVARLRLLYIQGTRVELVYMADPYTRLRPGDMGRVEFVDDAAGIHIAWDNGEGLAAIWGEDIIKIVPEEAGA